MVRETVQYIPFSNDNLYSKLLNNEIFQLTLTINHPYILSLSLNQQSKTYEIMYKNSFAKIWKNRQISKSISLPSPLIPIFGIYHLLRGRGWILLPLPP